MACRIFRFHFFIIMKPITIVVEFCLAVFVLPSPCTCSSSSDNEGTTDKLQLVLEIVQEAPQLREVEE